MEQKVLHWVRGNILRLAIPLEQETITEEQTTREDYIVQSDDVVTVNLVSSSRRYIYAPKSIEGNVVSIEDNGELDLGTYGVEVLLSKADGTRLRSFWNYLIKIHNTNDAVLEEWDDFADVSGEILDSAIFFFAKGDPFTYEDFTQEQLDEIKRPALEAAGVATQAAQNANDAATNANNAKNAAIIATNLANSATQNANDAASSANAAAISANQAKRNADTATINANNATESALQATSDAITATTDAKRATDKTEEAIEQAQRAAVIGSNPDFIGSDYYVYKYNARLGRYERSNIYVRGENGDKGEKGDKGDKGDAGTTDYNLLENKPTRVSQFENDADYATESFVNSSIATATATYRGSYNAVSDLHVSASASRQAIQQALDAAVTNADNNDYCFVQIPTADATPTEIARVERYKHDGSGWLYEYTLNNSGFTAEQWDAINSGITSDDVDKLDALPTNAQLTSLLNGKQDTINDLASIRSGASAGATAYQKPQAGIPESDLSQEVKDKMNEKEVFWATYGQTTAAEIDAAVAAGKEVLCLKDNTVYQLVINASNLTYIQFFSMLDTAVTYLRLKRSNNAWDATTTAFQKTSDKVTSFQSTPSNTKYPSEKLVKDSLDAKAGIGDVLFANFSNLTPKKTFEYDVSDTAYHPLFSRANTGISQLMSEVDDIVKFRITVTGTNIYARVDVVVRFQPALTSPCIMAWNENNSNIAANSGIYYMRTAIPKEINSGHDWFVEFNVNNATTRHIKVEVYEDTENITWAETNIASSYSNSYQTSSAFFISYYRGLCANQTWRFSDAWVYGSDHASFINSFLSMWVGGTIPLAGEALGGNQLVVMSNQQIYKATNKDVPIDCDCGVSLLGSNIATGQNVGFTYTRQKVSWTTLTGDPTLTMDTFARGDQVYLRCTLGQDGKIYPDGHLSNVKSAGYTWVHIGTAASATAINLDTCGKPFITLNNDGKVTHINGTAVMDSSMSKWGVVSQTQTWSGTGTEPRTYVMSNLVYGWIPQANIDLFVSAGAVFNETSGYFELNGLTDISYEEMQKIYSVEHMSSCVQAWTTRFFRTEIRTIIPLKTLIQIASVGSTNMNVMFTGSLVECVVFGKKNNSFSDTPSCSYLSYTFSACVNLRNILGRIVLSSTASSQTITNPFGGCYSLESLQLYRLGKSVSFPASSLLDLASIAYMIENEVSTSAITITLHPTAYARAIADSDVQAALQAHTNVSLASAT